MSPKPRASRHLGRRRPSSLGAAPWAEAVCWALMLHLGVAAWWGGELERQASAPALEPLRSVPPSAPRAVRWEPRPAARVSLAPVLTSARVPDPAPEAPPPESVEPTPREAREHEAPPPAPEPARWSELGGARSPRARPADAAVAASAAAPPPSASSPVETAQPAEAVDAAPPADASALDVAPPEPPEVDAPGERAEPAPAPSDAASSSVAEALADNLPPAYPALALRRGWEGRVLLEVVVDADGAAHTVSVLESSGVPLLDRTARQAVERWRFEPARRDGRAESGTTTVALRFQLDARSVGTEPNG